MSERRYEIWPDKDLAEALDDIDTRLKALEASETLLNDTTVADAQAAPIRQNVDTCGLVDEVERTLNNTCPENYARQAILKVADWLEDVPPHERTGLLPEDLLRDEVKR